ncbi:Hypothetical predicted protein [Cloeon dipterum]|uniref:Thyroglobulin type-1 domain-containing protein n=1 Tax=Cloeon dipterum TaxID=197152 RepID=A0A8S1E1F8_9INSE|nr:Hypothetical predicted protein [Cloeon dipterum]
MRHGELLIFSLAVLGAVTAQNDFPSCSGFVGCLGEPECGPYPNLLRPNRTVNNCCPSCVDHVVLGNDCDPEECLPGLDCKNGKCALPATGTCQSYEHRDLLWKPKCELDGKFSAVQCKGERLSGRCYCYSEDGRRIFGQQWWSKAENMTCGCSRKIEALKQQGRVDVTIHCTEDGNFDTLQCDSGVCWCADNITGQTLGEVVPEPMMQMLPCYNATAVGDSYLRRCDSAEYALKVIRDEMRTHGTVGDAFVSKNCGYDGSYGEYQFESGNRYCTWRDNSRIGSFMVGQLPPGGMNCYCARDSRYFQESGYLFTMLCSGDGSYIPMQSLEDKTVCVDKDGFPYAEIADTSEACPSLPATPYVLTEFEFFKLI